MNNNFDSDNIDSGAAGGLLIIDLDALQDNYRRLCAEAKPARTAAIVKADAYGIGAAQAAPALYKAGCRLFFVAQLIEALQLKPLLSPDATIAILNDIHPGMETTTADAGFIPVLNSLSSIEAWGDLCRKRREKLPAMLQIDTGMCRLGLDIKEIKQLVADPEIFNLADIYYILSHLACSDDSANNMNYTQLITLKKLLKKLPTAHVSFANSAAVYLGKDYRFDLVRPGIALYGIDPHGQTPSRLQPVVQLKARVIQTRSVPAGLKIGYGGTFLTKYPTQIATLAVGYADGWHRSLGNRGAAYFAGRRLPIIGRISMDSMMLDITTLGRKGPQRGDLVELIGPNQMLEDIARDADTIPYEILTSFGHRYERRYIQSE
ncbi:MAG: alanine racemase [Candidatus Tokpelaia sp. JSC189]|nr:MAG: alanine racemase [Candidatus Tokpelaia sp. JSC189]